MSMNTIECEVFVYEMEEFERDILGWFDFLLVREFRKFTVCMVQKDDTVLNMFLLGLKSSARVLFKNHIFTKSQWYKSSNKLFY